MPPGASHEQILSNALTAVTRYYLRFLDQSASARRVLWWHRFFFRQPATVVLRAAERTDPNKLHAELTSSARTLSWDYGVRVLIDASTNALPESALNTLRQDVHDVEAMPRSLLESLPELLNLHHALKNNGLDDVVWACLGGIPAAYRSLMKAQGDKPNFEKIVMANIQDKLGKAIGYRNEALRDSTNEQGLKELYSLFKHADAVPESKLNELCAKRPSPDKVLRLVQKRDSSASEGSGLGFLVPADPATAVVLRHQLHTVPSFLELKKMFVTRPSP